MDTFKYHEDDKRLPYPHYWSNWVCCNIKHYYQVHINTLEVTGCPRSVLQNTGDEVNIDRRFSDARQIFNNRSSKPAPDFETNQNNLQVLQALDKVDQPTTMEPGERWDTSWLSLIFIDILKQLGRCRLASILQQTRQFQLAGEGEENKALPQHGERYQ